MSSKADYEQYAKGQAVEVSYGPRGPTWVPWLVWVGGPSPVTLRILPGTHSTGSTPTLPSSAPASVSCWPTITPSPSCDRVRRKSECQVATLGQRPVVVRPVAPAILRLVLGMDSGLGARHGLLKGRGNPISTACVSTAEIHAPTPILAARRVAYGMQRQYTLPKEALHRDGLPGFSLLCGSEAPLGTASGGVEQRSTPPLVLDHQVPWSGHGRLSCRSAASGPW